MVVKETDYNRVRAWILIRTESPEITAHRLYQELGYNEEKAREDDDSYVLIRADVVDYHYNIVIPVDTAGWDVLQDLVSDIQRLTGASETAVVPVVEHIPYPPHNADGYITEEEAELYPDEGVVKVGRQKSSPGVNPWG